MELFGKTVKRIVLIVAAGAVIRLILAPFFTDPYDFAYWAATAFDVRNGDGIYSCYSQWYPPLWGYVISLMSPFIDLFNCTPTLGMYPEISDDDLLTGCGWVVTWKTAFLLKIPLIIADVLNCLMIYKLVNRLCSDQKKAENAAMLYIFCPLTIWVSSIQGQFDGIALLFILLSVCAYLEKKTFFCGMFLSLACITKVFPSLMILPMLALILLRCESGKEKLKNFALYGIGGISIAILLVIPQIINGEMSFVMSFLSTRTTGSVIIPAGFDPLSLAIPENLMPSTSHVSDFLIPTLLLDLVVTVFIFARGKYSDEESVFALSMAFCLYFIWPTAPGYTQYYVSVIGLMALCYCIKPAFAKLIIALGIIRLMSSMLGFDHLGPTVSMGLMSINTEIAIGAAIRHALIPINLIINYSTVVPILIAQYLFIRKLVIEHGGCASAE